MEKRQKFKIGVLCAKPFPKGMASTTRIISYSKGLIQNGAEVEVYSFDRVGDDSPDPLDGEVEGVKYFLPWKYHTKKGKFCHFFIDRPHIYWGTIRKIRVSHKHQPFDYFLVSTDFISHFRFFLPQLFMMRIPMAFVIDEYPLAIRMLKDRISMWDKLRYKLYHTFFRKRIVMTKALENYYNKEISPKPTYILCTVLDEKRFEGIVRQPVDRKYICYMGNMMLTKDNVDNIVRAFSMVAHDFPDIDLHLYGTPNSEDKAFVESCISECGMKERAFIKGRVDYEAVPQILVNATLLVASQPNTKRAEGGFPTKMGEYMMSHTPMLITDVGEIGEYVHDGETTFMVPPEDSVAYAEKIRYILTHESEAYQVASNAYAYAINNFTAKGATSEIIPFLKENYKM